MIQVLSANIFSVVWNIYLSYTTHKTVVTAAVQGTEEDSRKRT